MAVFPRSFNASNAGTSADGSALRVTVQQDSGLSAGAIAGIVVGIVMVLTLGAMGGFLFCRRRQFITSQRTVFSAPCMTKKSPKQLNFKRILGIDQRTILRDLSVYLAGQARYPTVAPVVFKDTILGNSNSGGNVFGLQRGIPRLYVNPRDVELGPNPVIEAHIVRALKSQRQTLAAINSRTSQQAVQKLLLSKAAPLSWQADRVRKSEDPLSSRRKIKSPRRKITRIRVDDSDVLSFIEGEDTDLPMLSESENLYPQSCVRYEGDSNTNICDTTPENDSTHPTSNEITPRSSSSTPASSNLTNSCSYPTAPEEVQDDREVLLDQLPTDGVIEHPTVALFPVHVEFTDPEPGSMPSVSKSVDSSSALLGSEIACEPDSSSTPISTPTAAALTGRDGNVIDLPFACPDCPLKFGTAGQRRTHYNRKHNRRYTCKICSASFNLGPDLLRHEQNVHRTMFSSAAKTFQCTNAWCAAPNKIFGRKDNFVRHQRQCRPTIEKAKSKLAGSDVGLT